MKDWRFHLRDGRATLSAAAVFILLFALYTLNHPAGFSANSNSFDPIADEGRPKTNLGKYLQTWVSIFRFTSPLDSIVDMNALIVVEETYIVNDILLHVTPPTK